MRLRNLSVWVARLALVVLLVLLGTAATPRRATPAPIQISVAGCWSDPIQGPAFVRIAEGFNKVQSAIPVKGIRGGAATQILTQVSAGNPPDVYWPSSGASFCTFHWGNLMAASVLFILPIVVLFVATQRTFIQGISMTGLKG